MVGRLMIGFDFFVMAVATALAVEGALSGKRDGHSCTAQPSNLGV
jgi:hypothetical protein